MSLTKKYLLHSSTFFSEYKCEYREKCQYLEYSKKALALFGSICGIHISITSYKNPNKKNYNSAVISSSCCLIFLSSFSYQIINIVLCV